MTQEMTSLEQSVMELLCEGNDEVLNILRKQLEVCKVKERELTGGGFYTYFEMPEGVQPVPCEKSFKLGDVKADIDGLKYGAGFLLYINNEGLLDFLEGYSYEEQWPENVSTFKVSK